MTPSAPAQAAARALWARSVGKGAGAVDVVPAAEQLCAQLRAGLGRWIGHAGFRALLERALTLTRAEHPALDAVWCEGDDRPAARASLRTLDPATVESGMVGLLTTIIELLGRIIGEEMAVRLVEQTGMPKRRGVLRIKSEGGRNG